MNKKTIGKVAALALACASVVPTFGVVASANVVLDQNTIADTKTITGTATLLKWAISYRTKTYNASYNANTFSYNTNYVAVESFSATNETGTVQYDSIPTNAVSATSGDTKYYYATSASASAMSKKITSAVTYQNTYKNYSSTATTVPTEGGSEAKKLWDKAWRNYVHNAKTVANWTTKTTDSTCYLYDDILADTTTATTVSANGTPTNPLLTPPDSEFKLYVYSSNIETNNNITMSALKDAMGTDTVAIADDTGLISTTGSTTYKIIVGDSTSTGTTTGSTITSATYSTPSSSYRTSSSYVYCSNLTHKYYPNLSALQSVEGVHSNYVQSVPSISYSSTNCYFDPVNGTYRSYLYDSYSYKVNNTENSVYKVNGYYYATYSDAYSAANGNTSKIDFVRTYSTTYDYFSNVTGSFYSTYYAALSASNGDSSKVDVFNGASTYDYYDPYYYYYLNYGNYSTTTKDTTSATMGKKSGWTAIAKSLKSTSAGSTVTVTMNDEETIPSTVLSAIKGRNVTVKFTLDNGVVYTVNGKDVTTAKDVDINTTYNTKNVPSKLAKAAVKKNDGVSSAQISIDSSSLGFTSDVTIKLPSKRAGYSAKLYRYNSSRNSLVLVDTATIKTNGKCTFENVTKGGDYVVVVY